jgi:hypothetical protein
MALVAIHVSPPMPFVCVELFPYLGKGFTHVGFLLIMIRNQNVMPIYLR